MKAAVRSILAALIIVGAAAAASVPSRQWSRVRDALAQGLPQTALGPTDSLIKDAERRHAWAEATRAVVLRIALEAAVQGNRPEEKISRMRAALATAPREMRPAMEAILADWYWQYFQRNRWRFAQRTATAAAPDSDFATWDLRRLYAEIDRHFTAALAAAPLLRRTPIADYDALLDRGSAPDRYRPTLYDFVAFEALEFYGSSEQAGARPEDPYVLPADGPVFAPRERFARASFASPDTSSPVLEGVRLYQALLRFHASDCDPAARIDADLWRLEFARAHAAGSSRDSCYAAALEHLIERDGAHELSARALHALASLRYRQGDALSAHALARRGFDRFPGSVGGRRCFNLIGEIEARSLSVTASENVWNSPAPTLSVTYRNLDHVYFRLVPYDFEREVNRARLPLPFRIRATDLDSLLAAPAARRWSVTLPPTADYKPRTEKVPVPQGLPAGGYVLISSARADFDAADNSRAATPIWVSDLALVLRDGRPGGSEGFVLDALGGAPVDGAQVETWHERGYDAMERGPTVQTDRNGMFHLEGDRRLTALLVRKGRRSIGYAQWLGGRNPWPEQFQPRTLFFLDRGLYRPGQTIQYKGLCVLLDPRRDDYSALAARSVRVTLIDVNGRELEHHEHVTNDLGSFSGTFTAPSGSLLGHMQLRADRGPDGWTSFRVEEYKRPRFMVTLEAPREAPRLADRVEVTGRAIAYTGAPVDGAQVAWRVMRDVSYPAWWGWRDWGHAVNPAGAQAIAHGTATTDAEGRFHVAFTALPDPSVPAEQEPTFRYVVTGDVTDGAGETRSTNLTVSVGYTALSAVLSAPDWQESERAIEIAVRTTTLDGVGQSAAGTLTVARLEEPSRVDRGPDAGTDYGESSPDVFERRPGTTSAGSNPSPDVRDVSRWPEGAVVAERAIHTDSLGADTLRLRLPAGHYRARLLTHDRFGKIVTALLPLRVLEPGAARCALMERDVFAIRETMLEPGGEFLALWGTGYATAHAFVEIECAGRVLQSWWTGSGRTQAAIRLHVTREMHGGFTVRVTRVAENRAYLHEQYVAVPWSDHVLHLRWEHFVSKLEPGRRETWTAVVSGPDATRVAAEMVATLYDASLDAFAPFAWPQLYGFRVNSDTRQPRFTVDATRLYGVNETWARESRDAALGYRSLPRGLLWGDYTFGLEDLARPGSSVTRPGGAQEGKQVESIEVRAEKRIDTKSSTTRQSLSAEKLKEIPVDNLSQAIATKAGIVAPGGELHFRGGRGGDAKFQFDGAAGSPPDLDAIAARRDLRETAFFFPQLRTNARGEVRIEFTAPEALTEWRFRAFVHDAGLRSGTLEAEAVTAKDLMVQPGPPRFLREGDELEFPVKVTNRSASPQRGTVRLRFTHAEDDAPADPALGNRAPEQPFDVPARSSRTYAWRVHVPDGAGVLEYKAVAATAALSDGEEGLVPVLSRRALVIESLPLPVRGPATRSFDFARLRHSGESATLRQQSVTVQMVSNPAWYAVMALPYLMECPYECSEQTFNRLYANTLARHIARSQPAIRSVFDQWRGTPALDSPLEKNAALESVLLEETPWLRQAHSESQARRNVGLLFEPGRLDRETDRLVEKLGHMQLPDGTWPWFPGGRGDAYITLYITTGFGRLRHLGVDVPIGPAVRSLQSLDAWMDRQYRDVLVGGVPRANHLSATIALYLYGRSFFLHEHPVPPNDREALDFWLGQARAHWLEMPDRQTRGHLALGLERFGDTTAARAIMRSVKEYSVTDEELGRYWRDTEASWWWYRAPIETQALMIEAFDEVSHDSAAVEGCRVWLLKQKQTQDWKTTKATADAVYALLLRGADLLASKALVEVTLGDSLVGPRSVEAGTGFYERRFDAASVRPEMGRITVRKSDAGVAWGSVHWQYLDDLDRITPYAGTPLRLTKTLFLRRAGKAGLELEPIDGALHPGDELLVRVELRSDRDMEYVHLEDDRGSGTEPVEVLSGYRYQDGLRYYAETRDVASHFFIDYLPKGTYVFEYPVRVQLRGRYASGVARVQCMYAPEFNSHSGSVPLVVE